MAGRKHAQGLAPLFSDFDSFYTRRLYTRIRVCWNRPITGVPGRTITVLERESKDYNVTFRLTGSQKTMINFASYNYLGFAQNEGPCADAVEVRGPRLRKGRGGGGESERGERSRAHVAQARGARQGRRGSSTA